MNRNRVAGRVVSDRAHQNWKWERRGADYTSKKNDFLVLKDKDVKIQNYDKALEKMYAHLKQWDVAVVGGMFVHGSKILNCGYIYDKDGVIYPACAGQKVRDRGYEDRICLAQDVSMVDPGFCMIDEKIYRKLGGFRRGLLGRDAMLDFCLRVKNAGYRVVYEPGVVVNRNSSTPESSKESHDNLLNVYGPKGTSDKIRFEDGDEFYNQNLPLGVWNYSLFD
jgi:GT2 family glycosyltransferase